jgi:uncharacterized membrane protein
MTTKNKIKHPPLGVQLNLLQKQIDKFKGILEQPDIRYEYKVIFLNTLDCLIAAKRELKFKIEDIKNNLCDN